MSPENAGCLVAGGIDCCVLANNHVLDWGRAGLLDTLATFQELGIKTAGAGRNLAEARTPANPRARGRAPAPGLLVRLPNKRDTAKLGSSP
jgi:poly-gamma-glutamate capsule biosynthesis protein CapA/YwtB (metallophosphatase superfamily)